MAFRVAVDTVNLVVRASHALGTNQREFANRIDTSHRTAQRMLAGHSSASDGQLRKLAALVYPKDRALAGELASAAGSSLIGLGLEASPPSQPIIIERSPPPRPPPLLIPLVDSVVCVAAEAQKVTPSEIRAALLAAFERGHELALTMEESAAALRSARPPGPTPEPVGKGGAVAGEGSISEGEEGADKAERKPGAKRKR